MHVGAILNKVDLMIDAVTDSKANFQDKVKIISKIKSEIIKKQQN